MSALENELATISEKLRTREEQETARAARYESTQSLINDNLAQMAAQMTNFFAQFEQHQTTPGPTGQMDTQDPFSSISDEEIMAIDVPGDGTPQRPTSGQKRNLLDRTPDRNLPSKIRVLPPTESRKRYLSSKKYISFTPR